MKAAVAPQLLALGSHLCLALELGVETSVSSTGGIAGPPCVDGACFPTRAESTQAGAVIVLVDPVYKFYFSYSELLSAFR